MNAPVITLLTDFGLTDSYVGQLKGNILSHHRGVCLIDLTHDIPRHDVATAAMVVYDSYRWFPQGSIHVIVVDPGVGSQRSLLVADGDGHLFLAPDNGCLGLLLQARRLDRVHRLHPQEPPQQGSATFHGRDILAPAAALLASGKDIAELGPAVDPASCLQLDLPQPQCVRDQVKGQIVSIDHFGNIRTSIRKNHLARYGTGVHWHVQVAGRTIPEIRSTYADVPVGEFAALFDSSGYLEIAVNQGSASSILACTAGDSVQVTQNDSLPSTKEIS